MPERGYAVINFTTTGLFPYQGDRVVEVAVVHLDEHGSIGERWHSIVNPESHLAGAAHHGVSTAEFLRAPTFGQIAPQLIDLLRGRVLVAHNAQFVTGFLMHELEMIDYSLGRGLEAVCTMHLARSYLPGAGRLLSDCCAAYDIDVEASPGAEGQAVACANLLAAYLNGSSGAAPWVNALDRAETSHWPALAADAPVEWVVRDPRDSTFCVLSPHFLARAAMKLTDYTGEDDHLDYLALLDLCLTYRVLSPRHIAELRVLAEISGLSAAECAVLHNDYFADLVDVALMHGALTVSDTADLIAVARLLSIEPQAVAVALATPTFQRQPVVATTDSVSLKQGDIVVLTGNMARARSDWGRELVARGLSVGTAVTLRTRLLVAADPTSVTGKTGKAHDYGIPIVSEFGLRSLIGVR